MARGIVSLSESPTNAHLITRCAAYLMRAPGNRTDAAKLAETEGNLRVAELIRAAVPSAITTDSDFGGPLSDWNVAVGAWFASMRDSSAFFRLLNDGALRKAPLGKRLGLVASGASAASVIGESMVTPLSRLTTSGATLDPVKAVAMVSISREVLLLMGQSADAEGIVNTELRSAVGQKVDETFLATITVGATSFTSIGNDEASMEADLRRALNATNCKGPARSLVWIAGEQAAKGAAVMDPTHQATPKGGTLVGLPMIVTDAADANSIYLVNGSGIVANADTIVLTSSEQSTIQLDDAPDSPPTASTVVVSAWQAGLAVLKASLFFGVKPFQSNVVSITSQIHWGGGNSP